MEYTEDYVDVNIAALSLEGPSEGAAFAEKVKSFVGETIFSLLAPGQMVLSGYTILDIIDGTKCRNDIDLFGTPDAWNNAKSVLASNGYTISVYLGCAAYAGLLVGVKRVMAEHTEGAYSKYKKVDLVCIEGRPIDEFIKCFDFSRNRVYFDGVSLVKDASWNEDPTCTFIRYTWDQIMPYLGVVAFHYPHYPPDYAAVEILRTAFRMCKYRFRGYSFYDVNGCAIYNRFHVGHIRRLDCNCLICAPVVSST